MTLSTFHHIRQRAAQPLDRLPSGWWLAPAVIGGAAGWAALIWAVT